MSTGKTATQWLNDLSAVSESMRNRAWSTGALAQLPQPADFGALIAPANPLATLNSAGVGMLTPHVAFLAKPLDEFRGDAGAVTAPAQGMASAAADVRALAETFLQASTTETSRWTGEAADSHRLTSAQLADGINAIAEAAVAISGAILGAGEDVVKALTEIVGTIGSAVGDMIPIMARGIASAPFTMGASIGEAIAECVGIAAAAGEKIAGIMANLLSDGMNLLQLIDMVLKIVHAVTQLMQKLVTLTESSETPAAAAETPTAAPETLAPGGQATPGPGGPGPAAPASDTPVTAPAVPATTTAGDPAAVAGVPGETSQSRALAAGARTGVAEPQANAPVPASGSVPTPGPAAGTTGAMPIATPLAGAAPGTGAPGDRFPRQPDATVVEQEFAVGDQDGIAASGVIGAEPEFPA